MQKHGWLLPVIGIAALGLIPIWRSGEKDHLTFYQFVKSHTIWGSFPQYIPVETLSEELTGEELDMLNAVHEANNILKEAKTDDNSGKS